MRGKNVGMQSNYFSVAASNIAFICFCALTLGIFFVSHEVNAEFYKFIDSSGVVHYMNVPTEARAERIAPFRYSIITKADNWVKIRPLRSFNESQGRHSAPQSRQKLIRAVQQFLIQIGLDPGPVDGVEGEKTRDAIKEFQKSFGLTPDGIISAEVLEKMLEIMKSAEKEKSKEPGIATPMPKKTGRLVTVGTGWVVGPGFIVTNYHVVKGQTSISLVLDESTKIDAHVFKYDVDSDLALLEVNPQDRGKIPPSIPLAEKPCQIGASVFTIGYPHPDIMGTKPKLTEGIVNAERGLKDDPKAYQISVPVQSGNSGGPLLNMNGEAVGIVKSKISAVNVLRKTGDLPQNVNYAIKAEYLRPLLASCPRNTDHINELPRNNGSLEELGTRIRNSVVLIFAE